MFFIKKILKVILRLAMFALSIVIVISNIRSCKSREEGTDNLLVASAEELIDENYGISVRAELPTETIDVNNNLRNASYNNFTGSTVPSVPYRLLKSIIFINFPNDTFTVECNILNQNVTVNISGYSSSGGLLFSLSLENTHITFPASSLSSLYSIRIDIYSKIVTSDEVSFDVDLFFYAGDYVPGFAQGVQAGYSQGYEAGVKSTAETLITEGNSTYATSAGNIYTYMVADDNSIKFQTTSHLGYVSLRFNSRLANGQKIVITYDSLDHDIAFGIISSYGQGLAQLFSIPASDTPNTVEVILNIDGIYGVSSDITKFEIQNFVGSSPETPVPITTITGLKIMAAPTNETFYDNGYENGYNDGKAVGITEGTQLGYNQAVSENLNNAGIFAGLISVLKLIFDLVGDFLAKPIAGNITLGLIFVGLPATFGLISMTINLVKKFVGGGGKDDG